MTYKYVTEKQSYEDLSSGRVLYNAPGLTAFPVRLADEIIQRCFAILNWAPSQKFVVYDPCCGGGYVLTSIGFLHSNRISKLIGSDCNPTALQIARKNLSLTQLEGMNFRRKELQNLFELYRKDSHKSAIDSTNVLAQCINPYLEIDCFQQDILSPSLKQFKADIVIVDFPYGALVNWNASSETAEQIFFAHIINYLTPRSVLVVISNKKTNPKDLKKIDHFKLGKRHINIFNNQD